MVVVEDEDEPTGKGKKPTRATERDLKSLKVKAEEIHENHNAIVKSDKISMSAALKAGKGLLWGKKELKRIKLKGGFKRWIEEECKLPYKRAYNYMKLAAAAETDSAIKAMGLTEAYEMLHLVKRKKPGINQPIENQDQNDATTPNTVPSAESEKQNNAKSPDTGAPNDNTTTHAARRTVGKCEVEFHIDHYVLEIDQTDLQTTLVDAIADVQNLTAVLQNGGLLIRLKSTENSITQNQS